jgi:hypothetical protein
MRELLIYNVAELRYRFNAEVRSHCVGLLEGQRIPNDIVFLQWLVYRLHDLYYIPIDLAFWDGGYWYPVDRVPYNDKIDASIYKQFSRGRARQHLLGIGVLTDVELKRSELLIHLNEGY